MNSADLNFVTHRTSLWFDTPRIASTNLFYTSLINASLYHAIFYYTEFSFTDLTYANMSNFYCRECHFRSAKLIQVELSFSKIFHVFLRCEFKTVNFTFSLF